MGKLAWPKGLDLLFDHMTFVKKRYATIDLLNGVCFVALVCFCFDFHIFVLHF